MFIGLLNTSDDFANSNVCLQDIIMLALDEICDGGVLLEADPASVVSRVALRTDDIPLGEQTVAQVTRLFSAVAGMGLSQRRYKSHWIKYFAFEFAFVLKLLKFPIQGPSKNWGQNGCYIGCKFVHDPQKKFAVPKFCFCSFLVS